MKTIKIRQEFLWHYVTVYLENLRGTGVMNDEKFKSRFDELYGYVRDKCNSDGVGGDIVDYYVVIEKSAKKDN